MLIIRLQRVGRRNHAEFRMVVSESARSAKSPHYVELLGSYSPHSGTAQIKGERVQYWISQGATLSDTVHNLLVSQKLIKSEKRTVTPKKTPEVVESK